MYPLPGEKRKQGKVWKSPKLNGRPMFAVEVQLACKTPHSQSSALHLAVPDFTASSPKGPLLFCEEQPHLAF
jgi:hypothetical protein